MLVWTALLCLVIPTVYVVGLAQVPDGLAWGLGNRDTALEFPLWVARAKRAHANLVENLAPFAIVVLTAHVAGEGNATTALGATLFFWARVAHFLVYAAGIPYVRTLAFGIAIIGEIMIVAQLFG
jgi:uncharacterized MAPEG superfamily protein